MPITVFCQRMKRLLSLDVFRGVTIASMILVNNPGSWQYVFPPLRHAEWHGWTFTDLVFPFFLWMVGVAMTLSFARRVEEGADRRKLLLHAMRRGATIFALGLMLNLVPRFDFGAVRIPGVLQRIGICYLLGSAIYLSTSARGLLVWIGGLLAAYWAMMAPGGYAMEQNFARTVDSIVLAGHMWTQTKVWDPEGVVSTIPAIATCLFGCLAGHLIRSAKPVAEKAVWLYLWGAGLMFTGLVWSTVMPINKSLWTGSYAVLMAGLASVCFASFLWICDGAQMGRRWLEPFRIYGMNAILLYIASGLLAKLMTLTGAQKWIWDTVYAGLFADPRFGSLTFALTEVLLLYVLAWALYRKGIFVRL